MRPTIGEIVMFGGNFAPRGWAFCHGQILSISQFQSLFSILETMYGGDGRTTFALPDLRGRTAIGAGTGQGLPSINEGQKGGVEDTRLNVGSEQVAKATGTTSPTVVTNIEPKGVSRSPYQGLNYIIALDGDFPSRT